MAISLISCEDNLTKTKIRCTVGCDHISDLDNIPVGDEDLSELGFANHKLAPWSFALVGEDGLLYYLTTTNEWKPYTNDGSGGGGSKLIINATKSGDAWSFDKTIDEIAEAGLNSEVHVTNTDIVYVCPLTYFFYTDSNNCDIGWLVQWAISDGGAGYEFNLNNGTIHGYEWNNT